MIYCQQLKKHIQLSQEDTQQLLSWNNNFFVNTTVVDLNMPIPYIYLMIKSFFLKEKYKKLETIVKSKRIALTIAALFLE
ncbi:hypothetical protein RhiirB3_460278, partial [Rhizophagus irregularis]